jgi:hypothetical protein
VDFRELLRSVKRRQASFMAGTSFEGAIAFIAGCDEASDRLLLSGFQAWLVTRTRSRPEIAWPGQVAHLTFADQPDRWGANGLSEDERETLRCRLFELLDEFLGERERRGLAPIYHEYMTWLTAQRWYDPAAFRHI